MKIIDLLIGITLMNAMPHYVLGVWKANMLSGFGVGHTKNVVWGLVNAIASVSLFVYQYRIDGLIENQIYLGALIVLVTFLFTSWFWYRFYNRATPQG
jgi:hypothetical protein